MAETADLRRTRGLVKDLAVIAKRVVLSDFLGPRDYCSQALTVKGRVAHTVCGPYNSEPKSGQNQAIQNATNTPS